MLVRNLHPVLKTEAAFNDVFGHQLARAALRLLACSLEIGEDEAFLVKRVHVVVNVEEVSRHPVLMR